MRTMVSSACAHVKRFPARIAICRGDWWPRTSRQSHASPTQATGTSIKKTSSRELLSILLVNITSRPSVD